MCALLEDEGDLAEEAVVVMLPDGEKDGEQVRIIHSYAACRELGRFRGGETLT